LDRVVIISAVKEGSKLIYGEEGTMVVGDTPEEIISKLKLEL